MDNRASRRKAAAAARHAATRSATSRSRRGTRAKPSGGGVLPAGASETPTGEPAESSEPVEPEALVVSHWFDPGDEGEPYVATVRVSGRRIGTDEVGEPRDTFTQEDVIEGVVPGSGPVSITTRVHGLQAGEWAVKGELLRSRTERGRSRHDGEPIARAAWSWRRWALSDGSTAPLVTRWAVLVPLARIPGVIRGSWAVLSLLAAAVAVATLALILAHEGIPVGPTLAVAIIAAASGLLGARLWYAFLNPGPWRRALLGGWAVDGFFVVASGVAVVGLVVSGQPIGLFLDAAAPGLLFAVAIGRIGCFLTGCCAGRMTCSRWGIWSSDRRIGARRIPTQLLESGAGLAIGVAAATLVLEHAVSVEGGVFVAAAAAYMVVRQVLLRLRADRREFSWRRSPTVASQRA